VRERVGPEEEWGLENPLVAGKEGVQFSKPKSAPGKFGRTVDEDRTDRSGEDGKGLILGRGLGKAKKNRGRILSRGGVTNSLLGPSQWRRRRAREGGQPATDMQEVDSEGQADRNGGGAKEEMRN